MSNYTAPEYKAGHTDEEYEKHGDAVLITWRDWTTLRDRVQEEKEGFDQEETPHEMYVAALEWVMQTMDEWPV